MLLLLVLRYNTIIFVNLNIKTGWKDSSLKGMVIIMKKICILLSVILLLTIFTACDQKKTENSENESVTTSQAPPPDCRTLLDKAIDIMGGKSGLVVYSDNEKDEPIDDFLLGDLYNSLDVTAESAKIGDIALFQPIEQIANEVHIVKPASNSDNNDVKGYLQNRLDRLKTVFVGYAPEQVTIASKGKIVEHKGYFLLVVTKDKNDDIINAVKALIDGK